MAGGLRAVTVSFIEHGLAVLRMHRGENRINKEFIDAFHSCLDEVESNTSCKGVITTAEGKFFSNGLDLNWLSQMEESFFSKFLNQVDELTSRILTFPMPTLAAINGHCFAGGSLLAFAHDLRVMNNEKGWISYNEVFINIRFTPYSIKYMQSKVSPEVLRDMLVFGQRFTGPEAESAQLVDKAVPILDLEKESQNLLLARLGKQGFPRESMHSMKKDVYIDALKDLYKPRS